MKRIWSALRGAFDVRDLVFVTGLGLFVAGLVRWASVDAALIGAGVVLLYAALRR